MSFWDYWILPVAHFLFFTLHLLTDTEVSCNRFSRLADATAACCRAPPEAPFVIPSEEVAKKLPDSREAFDFCVVVILPPDNSSSTWPAAGVRTMNYTTSGGRLCARCRRESVTNKGGVAV